MLDYQFFGYGNEEEFLEDILGCDEEYALEDFLIHMIQNKEKGGF